jgi:hypothetical protein
MYAKIVIQAQYIYLKVTFNQVTFLTPSPELHSCSRGGSIGHSRRIALHEPCSSPEYRAFLLDSSWDWINLPFSFLVKKLPDTGLSYILLPL